MLTVVRAFGLAFALVAVLTACESLSNAATMPPEAISAPPSWNVHVVLPDLSPEFETPPGQPNQPLVMIYSIGRLVGLNLLAGRPLPPDEIPLSDLTARFVGWTPVYLPKSSFSLDDQILFSCAIIDGELIARVRDAILAAGFDPAKVAPGDGYVAFFKNVIPPNYPTDRLVINWRTNQIVLYPVLDLATELNVPSFRWRIYQVADGQRVLIADWPVVVGKPSTRTPMVPHLLMNEMEHYPHWIDPETMRYVDPGPHNPLGIWKLRSSLTNKRWYYHGTNNPKLLGRDWRAFSHGCVRNENENIRRLGWVLVSHNAGEELRPGLVTGRLDVIPETRTRVTPLVRGVQAHNYYDTIAVLRHDPPENSVLVFYPNIYGVDWENENFHFSNLDHLTDTLVDLGITPDKIDEDRAEDLLKRMRKIRVATEMPVKDLLATEPGS
jgi:hypothetical protein